MPTWLDSPAAHDVYDPTALQGLFPNVGPTPMQPDQGVSVDSGAPMQPMQPGLGIPMSMFDQVMSAQQQQPVVPDAISGGQPPPMFAEQPSPQDAQAIAPNPAQPPIDERTLLDPFASHAPPGPLDPYGDVVGMNPLTNPNLSAQDAAAGLVNLQRTNPQAAAEATAIWAQQRDEDFAYEAQRAAIRDEKRIKDQLHDRQAAHDAANAKSAVIERDAIALASKKIDPERWATSRTAGQKIWNVIGALAGGAFAGTAGRGDGRNMFIEDMQKSIDVDIDAQKQDIQNGWQGIQARRGIVAEVYARTGDLHQAAETARLALRLSSRDQLLAEQQLYDPRGTTALRIAGSIQQVDAGIAQSRQAAFDKGFKTELDLRKDAREQMEAADRHAAMQAKLAGQGAGGGSGKILMSPAAFAQKNGLKVWGQAEQRMYGDYVTKEQARGGGIAPSATPQSRAVAQGALPSTPGATRAPQVPSKAQPIAAAPSNSAVPTVKYKTKDDWFSVNRPTSNAPEDRKRFWFVDGKNGSDVPPVELEAGVDPEKFIKGQRVRREMAEKADQLRILTERLDKKGAWTTAKNSFKWTTDEDAREARALSEDFTGLVIQAKEMGVPSGNDVERVKTMVGGDPAGWVSPLPALQRARESVQLEQDADWGTASPSAAADPAYNRFRVLPGAKADWVKKVEGRGVVKEVVPELGNTDPAQFKGRTIFGDAPNAAQAEQQEVRSVRSKYALAYLKGSGAVLDDASIPDELSLKKTTSGPQAVQVADFKYAGIPHAGDAWRLLRDQHVSGVASLHKYLKTGDVEQWKGFKKAERIAEDAINDLFQADPGLYRKYIKADANYIDHLDLTPEAVARLSGQLLKSGGRH